MKVLFDFFPLLVFFGAYALADIYTATAAAMGATLLQVAWVGIRHRKIDTLLKVNAAAIFIMGGLTLALHDKRFIMFKPTLVYWLIAGGLLVAHFLYRKNPVESLLKEHFDAPPPVWRRWLLIWVVYFVFIGVLNLVVAYTLSEAAWVKFKVFGVLVATLALSAGQAFGMMRYARAENTETTNTEP